MRIDIYKTIDNHFVLKIYEDLEKSNEGYFRTISEILKVIELYFFDLLNTERLNKYQMDIYLKEQKKEIK